MGQFEGGPFAEIWPPPLGQHRAFPHFSRRAVELDVCWLSNREMDERPTDETRRRSSETSNDSEHRADDSPVGRGRAQQQREEEIEQKVGAKEGQIEETELQTAESGQGSVYRPQCVLSSQ